MSAKSKSEWTGEEAKTYAKHCVFESTTIGSEAVQQPGRNAKRRMDDARVADYANIASLRPPNSRLGHL